MARHMHFASLLTFIFFKD